MTPRGWWLLCTSAVVLIAAGAFTRLYFNPSPSTAATLKVPAGSASPPSPSDLAVDDFAAPKIPEHLPDFALKDLSGKSTPVSRWAGKSLMINFWATWCAPCRQEIPLLKTLSGELQGKNVQIIGIAVDYPDKVEDYAGQMKIGYPLLVGEQDALDVATALGVASPAFPFTVFTDQKGEVVTLFVGALHRPQVDLILKEVDAVNLGQRALSEAREKIAAGLAELTESTAKGS
jgi:thiol-disulfide isomerase/thioredoxin